MRHLDHDWELERAENFWIHHFWDTIRVLGGWKGMVVIALGLAAFYSFVVYTIDQGRKKRESKSRKRA